VPIDDLRLYKTVTSIQDRLTADEAGAIIDVARLAAAADNKTNIDEMTVLLKLRRIMAELAGGQIPHPSAAIDAHRLANIGEQLVATGARELAFASAFLVMIHDLELTREESDLARKLGDALVIDPARAAQLAAGMESLVRSA
jgi:hypothetical protein